MSMKAYWEIKNQQEALRSHASDYRTVFDAFYEYIKNLEEATAKNIIIEILNDRKVLLVYGDSNGLGVPELEAMRTSIGVSSKGASHHGLGIIAFMRFAKKMVTVSRKNGKLYILSCQGEDDGTRISSDTGPAREVTSEDRELAFYYNKLNALGDTDGTIVILEGVGDYKSDRFDFRFDIKQEFEPKEFVKKLQEKLSFGMHYRNYFLKVEGGDPSVKKYKKKERIQAKIGTGKKYEFTIPSARFPEEAVPGRNHDHFEYNGRQFKLRVKFTFYVGPSNDGVVQIAENQQNGLILREAIRVKLSSDSVFKNSEYLSFLNGLVDFKIIPLDGGDGINVYTGTRTALLLDNSFGDCLCNILNFADEEVIRPAIGKAEKKSGNRIDDVRSNILQKDMEMFFRDNKDIFTDIEVTKHSGPVIGAGMVKCHRCQMTVLPKRGLKSYEIDTYEKNVIYAYEDIPKYRCGNCGTVWDRRTYEHDGTKAPSVYHHLEKGEGIDRRKKRGAGFSYKICPFDRGDERRSFIFDDTVKINKNHMDYQSICNAPKHKDNLTIYERLMAMHSIVEHTCTDVSRDECSKLFEKYTARVLTWFSTKRQRISSEEVDKLHEQDEQDEQAQNNVGNLANNWGAKVGNIK